MRLTTEEKRQLVMRYQTGESVTSICADTGIARSTLYSWIKSFHVVKSRRGTQVTPHDYDVLKKRVEKLEGIVQVLKAANCTVSAPLQDKLAALESLYGQFSVHTLCDALEVPRGTFYNHILRRKGTNAWYAKRRADLCEKIQELYDANRQLFGPEKIRALLMQQGEKVSKSYVTTLMREMGLRSISPSAKKDYRHLLESPPKRNILNRNFSAERMNQIWVSDITCFKLKGKRYYIVIIMDLFSRKIISYGISPSSRTRLVTTAFRKAYEERRPKRGLIFHSDRGTQYTSQAFQELLASHGVTQSFSNSGKPTDNAVAEAFFSCLKREELYRTNYHSVDEFKRGVEAYMTFYNTKRPHKTLNYKCPDQVEKIAQQRAIEDK